MPNGVIPLVREKIAQNIRRHGWMSLSVSADSNFTYTTGLSEKGWPELIVFGVPGQVAHDIITKIVQKNVCPTEGERFQYNGFPAVLRAVPSEAACRQYAVQACAYYERLLPISQVVLSDKNKVLPWEPGCLAQSQSVIMDWASCPPL